jgi:hypothetical protein
MSVSRGDLERGKRFIDLACLIEAEVCHAQKAAQKLHVRKTPELNCAC